jgi:hypothetical protein
MQGTITAPKTLNTEDSELCNHGARRAGEYAEEDTSRKQNEIQGWLSYLQVSTVALSVHHRMVLLML